MFYFYTPWKYKKIKGVLTFSRGYKNEKLAQKWVKRLMKRFFFYWHPVLIVWYYKSSHQRCSIKKVSLKISQNLLENICIIDFFLIKLQA